MFVCKWFGGVGSRGCLLLDSLETVLRFVG